MDKRLGYHADIRHKGTPEHDEMCMFVHDNAISIAKVILTHRGEYEKIHKYGTICVSYPQFEEPVTFQKNSYNEEEIIGYVDVGMGVIIKDIGKRHSEFPDWYYAESKDAIIKTVNFEIKPAIPSFGDVVRQIKYYQQYSKDNEQWVVVTKTPGLKQYFNSQDIIVFEYDELKREIEILKMKEKKEQEEIERIAREKKENMIRRWNSTKKFVARLFRNKDFKKDEESVKHQCAECGRQIKHRGKCLACNIKNKKRDTPK